jgi:hypothetical protein
MITLEAWNSSSHRSATRQYFASEAGQAFLQLMHRASALPEGVSESHSAEVELGRREGFFQCLRLIEGTALAPENQKFENIDSTYEADEDLEKGKP